MEEFSNDENHTILEVRRRAESLRDSLASLPPETPLSGETGRDILELILDQDEYFTRMTRYLLREIGWVGMTARCACTSNVGMNATFDRINPNSDVWVRPVTAITHATRSSREVRDFIEASGHKSGVVVLSTHETNVERAKLSLHVLTETLHKRFERGIYKDVLSQADGNVPAPKVSGQDRC